MLRYADEQRKAQMDADQRTAILTKYGFLEKTLPQAAAPGAESPAFRADMPRVMGNLEERLAELAPGQIKKKSPFESKEDWSEFVTAKGLNAESLWSSLIEAGKVKTTETPEGRASNYQDFRYSRFDINQAFAEGFDPDRIAVAFATDLARVGEMKMQSQMTPPYAP
jgi:hypothetical protein